MNISLRKHLSQHRKETTFGRHFDLHCLTKDTVFIVAL